MNGDLERVEQRPKARHGLARRSACRRNIQSGWRSRKVATVRDQPPRGSPGRLTSRSCSTKTRMSAWNGARWSRGAAAVEGACQESCDERSRLRLLANRPRDAAPGDDRLRIEARREPLAREHGDRVIEQRARPAHAASREVEGRAPYDRRRAASGSPEADAEGRSGSRAVRSSGSTYRSSFSGGDVVEEAVERARPRLPAA